jgi:hypothetical protein
VRGISESVERKADVFEWGFLILSIILISERFPEQRSPQFSGMMFNNSGTSERFPERESPERPTPREDLTELKSHSDCMSTQTQFHSRLAICCGESGSIDLISAACYFKHDHLKT